MYVLFSFFDILGPSFLAGFCEKGPNCKFVHPSFEIPKEEDYQMKKVTIIPPKPIEISKDAPKPQQQQYRPIESVTCYKCHQKGHYANKCPNKKTLLLEEFPE